MASPTPPDTEPRKSDPPKVDLDLFKTYLATAEKVSDRRGAANQWLLSINSAIVGLYGFIASGKEVGGADLVEVWRWAIPVAGITVCLAWGSILANYRKLNRAKFAVLNEMEQHLALPVFQKEEAFYRAEGRRDLSVAEAVIPWIFGGLYIVFLVTAAMG